jgi:hypothetical protein
MQLLWYTILYKINSLRRWHSNTTITILDIIHRPVFYLKHDVSDTEFCLHLQVEPNKMGPIEKASLSLWTARDHEDD